MLLLNPGPGGPAGGGQHGLCCWSAFTAPVSPPHSLRTGWKPPKRSAQGGLRLRIHHGEGRRGAGQRAEPREGAVISPSLTSLQPVAQVAWHGRGGLPGHGAGYWAHPGADPPAEPAPQPEPPSAAPWPGAARSLPPHAPSCSWLPSAASAFTTLLRQELTKKLMPNCKVSTWRCTRQVRGVLVGGGTWRATKSLLTKFAPR